MQQIIVVGLPNSGSVLLDIDDEMLSKGIDLITAIRHILQLRHLLLPCSFYFTNGSKCIDPKLKLRELSIKNAAGFPCTLQVNMRLLGGIDFQNREGSKIGSGGQLSDAQAALARRDRLRKLALETIDLQKDPYFMRNHLGSYECKLCLTLHPNEGNYLAHTQAKRHQSNLGRRAALEAKSTAPLPSITQDVKKRKTMKIGRPGYKVAKSRDLQTQQRALNFEIDYPEADENVQPRHRFMSAYEQKVEVPDKNYQYLLFACDPYETIAFKIPNQPIDRRDGRFFTSWDQSSKKFVLSMFLM